MRNNDEFYDVHFMPEKRDRIVHEGKLPQDRANNESRVRGKKGKAKKNKQKQLKQSEPTPPLQWGQFPVASHIVTHGHPRTATTLLFNMVSASYFLHLLHHDPARIPTLHFQNWKRNGYILKAEKKKTLVLKTHVDLDEFKANNTVIFTAAVDRAEAVQTRDRLRKEGYKLAFVQDMESLKADGIPGLVSHYVQGYSLTTDDYQDLSEYFSHWEILRQCCGQQMSKKWRNDMMPLQYKRKDLDPHPTCGNYDIDEVENALMSTNLYAKMQQYPNMMALNKPSLNDDALNGTYCSSYNFRVKTEGLSFFGTPGGRLTRSGLDKAIKDQYNLGEDNLSNEGIQMMRDIGMRSVWRKDELEKKLWLKKLVGERTEKKSYKELKDLDDSLEWTGWSWRGKKEDGEGIEAEDDDDDVVNDEMDEDVEDEEPSDADASQLESTEVTDTKLKKPIINKPIIQNPDLPTIQDQSFDKTHAIFLISFGEEAAASTLLERCILSLRRRGQYSGYVVVLTDAPHERYVHVWDENVIVMHPQREHLLNEDGSSMEFTKDNMSLKPKRFKTYILDYVEMDQRLDDVELVYYLDIDILAGDSLDGLFRGVEEKYQVVGQRDEEDVSKLYFFTPISKEWPLQGGTFIVERGTSQHCLDLWRVEIDMMTLTGRGRDQDALRNIYQRIESGDETKCQLIRMDNENYISFPTPRNFASLSAANAKHAHLIHISNSVYAKRIDEEEQNAYIHEILQLTKEEKESGMYGKAVVRAKDSS